MSNNLGYFKNRYSNMSHAREVLEWAKTTTIHYTDYFDDNNISAMLANSIYNVTNSDIRENIEENKGFIKVTGNDTVTELFNNMNYPGKICILNFASYTNPGGKFLEGSMAQEEALCHNSNLYLYLNQFKDTYYKNNSKDKVYGFYKNRALYSHDVTFIKDGIVKNADVITIAAPNLNAVEYNIQNGKMVSSMIDNIDKFNLSVLYDRTKFIRSIMELEDVSLAILGAWGCGVFKQNPITVANMFKEVFKYTRINQIYAVPSGFHTDNYIAFKNTFEEEVK